MANNVTGLGNLDLISTPNDPANPLDKEQQAAAYFAAANGVMGASKYGPGGSAPDSGPSDYLDSIGNKNGLANQTKQSNQFGDTLYLDWLNANGSAILNVDGTQSGNLDVAQTNDYAAEDAYYKHQTP